MSAHPAAALTRGELVAMLNALRDRYLADKQYLTTPIGHLAGRYLAALRFDGYSPKTIRNREQTLGWLSWDYQDLEPADVTHDLLRGFLEQHWSELAGNTKAVHVSGLRCFFDWAHDHDHVPANPARKLRAPRIPDTRRRAHPVETIRKLVVSQDDRRDRVAILLLYWCGLRRNELRVVQWQHINLATRLLTVFGKGGRVVEQNLPEEVALELERLAQDTAPAPDEYLLFPVKIGRGGGWQQDGYRVVWSDRRRPLSESGVDKWWQRCRDRAGLPDDERRVLMHEMRHSAGTHMQQAGHDILATQRFMRHTNPNVTAKSYIHLDTQQLVSGVQRGMPTILGGEEGA